VNEQSLLQWLDDRLPAAGDDTAVIDGLALSTDMLHESTHFPAGTTEYTAGWRAVAASLSDLAAVGAEPVAAVAAYGTPTLERSALTAFVDGAVTVCDQTGTEYVGGDLNTHPEWTVASTALGRVSSPVGRSGGSPGEAVCVTGRLGQTAAALALFDDGDSEQANELFRFEPRVTAGQLLADAATAMIDSSDGLARSVHQLAAASGCGVALESPLPIHEAVPTDRSRELGLFVGEDFELVCTVPPHTVEPLENKLTIPFSRIGTTTDGSVTIDGQSLPDRGYDHGDSDDS
jgi:thiamine-monophosphate kinase